jgi:pyruvate formate lyase activating enzyme
LYSEVYGKPVAIHVDPVEKKPLYHFFPGRNVLSIGTYGCNLKCSFCQNCDISQVFPENANTRERSAEEIAEKAFDQPGNIGLAYTYNEPLMFFEYLIDVARIIKSRGFKNIMVSNGFISDDPLSELLEVIDAFKIDLKAFNEDFYRIQTKSSLAPVLNTIERISSSGKHIEITFLAIPELNDDPEEFERMTGWIAEKCGRNTVLHISRYFPAYHMATSSTPLKTLEDLYRIASEKLDYVYIGNTELIEGKDTHCPACRNTMISRAGYYARTSGLTPSGNCKYCGEFIMKDLIF